MGKFFTFILGLIALSGTAFGQQTKPSDVDEYVRVIPTYAAGTAVNKPLDPTITPPVQQGLPDIPTSRIGRVVVGEPQCPTQAVPFPNNEPRTCNERKFRTGVNDTTVKYDDPIRNARQPGGAHCHSFFGNYNINSYSIYGSIRTNARSFAAGAELNATGYWRPCMEIANAFGDGKNYAIVADTNIVYYVEEAEPGFVLTTPPLGMRYIIGYDMDDPSKSRFQPYIDAANAQAGTAGRYRLTQDGNPYDDNDRQMQWGCTGSVISTYTLKNADGSDPFNGTCQPGQQINIQIVGQTCWDGKNLWSPTGYDHVIMRVWDTVQSKFVCPNNYYQIAHLNIQTQFSHEGFAGPRGYGNWRLSSDNARQTATGQPVLPGSTFHTDWFGGWDGGVWTEVNSYCLGAENNSPHECNNSAFSDTEALIVSDAAPDGRFPQVTNGTFGTSDPSLMVLLPDTANLPTVVHVHGN